MCSITILPGLLAGFFFQFSLRLLLHFILQRNQTQRTLGRRKERKKKQGQLLILHNLHQSHQVLCKNVSRRPETSFNAYANESCHARALDSIHYSTLRSYPMACFLHILTL